MRLCLLIVGFLLSSPLAAAAAPTPIAAGNTVQDCQRGCNKRCHGAKNKSKCVNECRRACAR